MLDLRPDNGGADGEYGRGGEYRAAARAEPEQQGKQEDSRRYQRPGACEQAQRKSVCYRHNDDRQYAL